MKSFMTLVAIMIGVWGGLFAGLIYIGVHFLSKFW